MRRLLAASLMGMAMLATGCSGDRIENYAGTTPVMSFEEFFNGPIQAHGLVHNRKGQVIRRFDVVMQGSWNGNEGVLDEKFTYYDGEVSSRVWKVRKIAENKYVGTADDIVGEATGESLGMAIRWNYVMQVKVDGSTYNINFDDWMFRTNGDTILNRSYMTKWGFRVGDITVVMRKL